MKRLLVWVSVAACLPAMNVEEALARFPKSTELVFVAAKPATFSRKNEKLTERSIASTFALALGSEREMEGVRVRFGVAGARNLRRVRIDRPPHETTDSDSCVIIGLPESFVRRAPDFRSGTGETKSTWMRPLASDVLLACDNQEFFQELLTSKPARTMNLSQLPEWSQVNRKSPFWGFRHWPEPVRSPIPSWLDLGKGRGEGLEGLTGVTFEMNTVIRSLAVGASWQRP